MASDSHGGPDRDSQTGIFSNEWFVPGLFFILIGSIGLYVSRGYDVGNVNQMGPGWFPRALCLGLIVLGGIIAANGLRTRGLPRVPPGGLRGFVVILLAMILFGLTIEGMTLPFLDLNVPRLGFVPALTLCLCVAACADRNQKPLQAMLTIVLVVIGSVAIFVGALGLPFRLWPGV